MAVALCDADKDLLYPIVAPFSKLLERLSNKPKIFMVHFTSVFVTEKSTIIQLYPYTPQEAQASILTLC